MYLIEMIYRVKITFSLIHAVLPPVPGESYSGGPVTGPPVSGSFSLSKLTIIFIPY